MIKVYWPDKLARDIVGRKKYNYLDKEIPKIKKFVLKSSTSISGVPHIGNASDVIRHDALFRALNGMGKPTRLLWVAEDMDALRKVPAGIPPEFRNYLGMPVADIPWVDDKSYSTHFSDLFIESFEDYGVKVECKSTAKAYRSGEFTKGIKTIMKNLDLIKEIWNKSRETPLPANWNPWKPVCENCGKIMTTAVKGFDESGVSYKCEDFKFKEYGKEAYTKLSGCGYEGESKFSDGDGKLLWRVEWGMEWATWGVCFEAAGKEHFMPSSSFWTAGEVCERVFGWPEPHPSENPLQPYGYMTVSGEKMSASKGNVVATWDWPKFAPPQILRLIFLENPRRTKDFSYLKIPQYVDEYDRLQRVYFGEEKIDNERERENLKRLYELIEVEIPEKMPVQIPFSSAAAVSQIYNPKESPEKALNLARRVCGIRKKLSEADKKMILEKRLIVARNWVETYAPQNYGIAIQERVPAEIKRSFSEKQKAALRILCQELETKEWSEAGLENRIYALRDEVGISSKDLFQSIYLALIGEKQGIKAAALICAIGKDKVCGVLKQI
ncbi:MAG TPA: lysine--tRNA ligase [Thermoplasmata archaeon]|nr:lysine--tRNA ligase [Thermoplasmata archaeon]